MDLELGSGKQILWIEPDTTQDDFNADYIIAKYPEFWKGLELYCVAECCGLDAYRFYPEDIIEASKSVNKEELKNDLSILIKDTLNTPLQNVSCRALNHIMVKDVFIQLMEHIKTHL